MKVLQKKITPSNKSFSIYKNNNPYLDESWHLHQELELIYIVEGYGTCYIGDNIHEFSAGELALIGPNMPHLWKNSNDYKKDPTLKAEIIVIHFNNNFLGESFFERNEMILLKNLLKKSENGVSFLETNLKERIFKKIIQLIDLKGFESILCLLNILNDLSRAKRIKTFVNEGYSKNVYVKDSQRLEKVYEYVLANINNEITLSKVAAIAHLGESPFCRFFKKRMHKTFSQFLNEIRIGNACKLLIEGKYTILEIAYQCGYNSQTNFNRQFLKIKGVNPKTFQKMYLGK